jgi:uncharacterized protein YndB with AHSA1/START domain
MPVKKDPSGKRSVQAEAEVPGTPEQVWRAIATGPGVSSWFVPTRVEEHEGGTIEASFGPGMDSKSKITLWDPPRRFVTEDAPDEWGVGDGEQAGPRALASEWTVEARSGGTCVVRVVHSWFADTDDWDNQYEGTQYGWVSFFRILRAYLRDFSGQQSAILQFLPSQPEAKDAAWAKLNQALGLENLAHGAPFRTRAGAPRLSGQIEYSAAGEHAEILLRLEEPAPGLCHLFALPMGGQVFLPIRLYLFGKTPEDTARREEAVWQKWLESLF